MHLEQADHLQNVPPLECGLSLHDTHRWVCFPCFLSSCYASCLFLLVALTCLPRGNPIRFLLTFLVSSRESQPEWKVTSISGLRAACPTPFFCQTLGSHELLHWGGSCIPSDVRQHRNRDCDSYGIHSNQMPKLQVAHRASHGSISHHMIRLVAIADC